MSDKIPPLCDQPKWNHIRHRCCCVFDHDSDEDEPLAECHYHERIRARLAEAEAEIARYNAESRQRQARLAEAERDADRYRWLREENHAFDWDGFPWPKGFTWDDDVDMCVNLDRAIDIARAADSAPAATRKVVPPGWRDVLARTVNVLDAENKELRSAETVAWMICEPECKYGPTFGTENAAWSALTKAPPGSELVELVRRGK